MLLSSLHPRHYLFLTLKHSFQRNVHSILCNSVIFLILKHVQQPNRDEVHERPISLGDQDYTLAVFTTVVDDSFVSSSNQSITYSWAQQQWIS